MDLVSHDGGNYRGDFIQSLQFTDIKICWTEMVGVKNKAQSSLPEADHTAQIPCRRILSSPHIKDEIKMKLERLYDKLNSAQLKREITRLQNELYRLSALQQNKDRETAKDKKSQGSLEYIST